MDDRDRKVQQKLDAAMPWVGLYIAVASAICTIAMTADVVNGVRHRKLWFPCKYFSIDAAFLTLLAVATKLPTDLDTQMQYSADWLARTIGSHFMITAMSNLMPSLACKSNNGILTNIVAMGILVITILVNIWIQTIQLVDFNAQQDNNAVIAATFFMLLLLATMISLAITLPIIKRIVESKYQEITKMASREQEATERRDGFTIDKQTVDEMKKYWIAAETGNPQFVAARSIFCVTSGVVCFLSNITLVIIYIKWFQLEQGVSLGKTKTTYGGYTKWIMVVQTIGAAVGMIAPIFRWSMAVWFEFPKFWNKVSLPKEFKIEPHWTQSLVEWRESFTILRIHEDYSGYSSCLYNAKWFILTVCIGLQIFIVLLSKTLLLSSVFLASPFFLFMDGVEKLKAVQLTRIPSNGQPIGLEADELNLCRYVLLLEGEMGLPARILVNFCHRAGNVIQEGKSRQPRNLISILRKFESSNLVGKFDGKKVPSLCSHEPLNCWTLALVTLTTIAAALPNAPDNKIKELVRGVNEGLSLTMLMDETLDADVRLNNIRKATTMVWAEVTFYSKWQGIDLTKLSCKYKKSKEVLQELSTISEKTVVEFHRDAKDSLMENPLLNWPPIVLASNSMYRITQSILLAFQEEDEETDDNLFEKLCVMIAGVMADCLTKLKTAIITMCHCNDIEKRENSLGQGFLLLGKTEQIFELLRQQEWPIMEHGNAACIEEWCALIQPDDDVDQVQTPLPNEEQITIVTHHY